MSETEILTVRHDHTDKVRKLGCPACMVLQDVLAEVRRLRAAVEAVQLMPRYDISTTQVGSSMEPDSFGDWVKYDDVLAALEGE